MAKAMNMYWEITDPVEISREQAYAMHAVGAEIYYRYPIFESHIWLRAFLMVNYRFDPDAIFAVEGPDNG